MSMNLNELSAGQCARQLLNALNNGSDRDVRRALDGIAGLDCDAGVDARELEFRDLLVGIVEPIARSAQDSRSSKVAFQMLTHVAGFAA